MLRLCHPERNARCLLPTRIVCGSGRARSEEPALSKAERYPAFPEEMDGIEPDVVPTGSVQPILRDDLLVQLNSPAGPVGNAINAIL